MVKKTLDLSHLTQNELIVILEARFSKHMERHPQLTWAPVKEALENNPAVLAILLEMEKTGGEPDVVAVDLQQSGYLFYDCSAESPEGRRSYCYDDVALNARKKHKPENSAVNCAQQMGIELLSEEEYGYLQTLGTFDLKTSSWLATPIEVRNLGGALFGDKRYNRTFTYHNGADSYYANRGFRGKTSVPYS
ncbi:DUF4256 domain-containing protein [Enterococcus eurekensis]|uniref:DUF4256 domain-containing protein n=1 Tax=Enterococcus eurekensis TaxID=1159753 RepID=A0ABV9M2H8_9ENTE